MNPQDVHSVTLHGRSFETKIVNLRVSSLYHGPPQKGMQLMGADEKPQPWMPGDQVLTLTAIIREPSQVQQAPISEEALATIRKKIGIPGRPTKAAVVPAPRNIKKKRKGAKR